MDVKIGQVWRDKDKRRDTTIEIIGVAYSEAEGHVAVGLVVGTEEERTYKVERLTTRWVMTREAPETAVVWDEQGAMSFLAEHDHVHDTQGQCIKNRHNVPCNAPKKPTQVTYMRKMVTACSKCDPGYKLRMTSKWVDEVGAPLCPHGVEMMEEVK